MEYPVRISMVEHDVGHSPQTRSFEPGKIDDMNGMQLFCSLLRLRAITHYRLGFHSICELVVPPQTAQIALTGHSSSSSGNPIVLTFATRKKLIHVK